MVLAVVVGSAARGAWRVANAPNPPLRIRPSESAPPNPSLRIRPSGPLPSPQVLGSVCWEPAMRALAAAARTAAARAESESARRRAEAKQQMEKWKRGRERQNEVK